MKSIKFSSKKRGPKGEGRAVIYKPVQLPVDLIEDLKITRTHTECSSLRKKMNMEIPSLYM